MDGLCAATIAGDLKTVVRLISKGAADDNEDYGYIAFLLTIAASCGHIKIVRELVKAGALIDARNKDGDSVLSKVIRRCPWNLEQVIRHLSDAGQTRRKGYLNRDKLTREIANNPELVSYLKKQLGSVPTLRESCRVSLRNYFCHLRISSSMRQLIDKLLLPTSLNNFLLFNDLEDISSRLSAYESEVNCKSIGDQSINTESSDSQSSDDWDNQSTHQSVDLPVIHPIKCCCSIVY